MMSDETESAAENNAGKEVSKKIKEKKRSRNKEKKAPVKRKKAKKERKITENDESSDNDVIFNIIDYCFILYWPRLILTKNSNCR